MMGYKNANTISHFRQTAYDNIPAGTSFLTHAVHPSGHESVRVSEV